MSARRDGAPWKMNANRMPELRARRTGGRGGAGAGRVRRFIRVVAQLHKCKQGNELRLGAEISALGRKPLTIQGLRQESPRIAPQPYCISRATKSDS
jgi:hypothetical protein